MKRKKKILIITVSSVLFLSLSFAALAIWYNMPVKIEDMNRMCYCACGFAKVEFKAGKIYIVQHHHDSLRPGDCIGTYSISGNNIDLLVDFDNKQYLYNCELDHIGLRNKNIGEYIPVYHAYNGRSYKLTVHAVLKKIGL